MLVCFPQLYRHDTNKRCLTVNNIDCRSVYLGNWSVGPTLRSILQHICPFPRGGGGWNCRAICGTSQGRGLLFRRRGRWPGSQGNCGEEGPRARGIDPKAAKTSRCEFCNSMFSFWCDWLGAVCVEIDRGRAEATRRQARGCRLVWLWCAGPAAFSQPQISPQVGILVMNHGVYTDYLSTVPVPGHWNAKRDYLAGKRGIEKPPYLLPCM